MGVVIRRLKSGDETRAGGVAATFKAAAGFVLAYRLQRLDREAAQLFVYEIGVTSQYRHGGIGTSLMGYVRELLAEESLMEAFVLADQGNPAAVRLYHSTGGHVEGAGSVLFVYSGHAA